MKILPATFSILALAACTGQPVAAPGLYRLSMAEKSMLLDVRVGGDYVLQVDGPGSLARHRTRSRRRHLGRHDRAQRRHLPRRGRPGLLFEG